MKKRRPPEVKGLDTVYRPSAQFSSHTIRVSGLHTQQSKLLTEGKAKESAEERRVMESGRWNLGRRQGYTCFLHPGAANGDQWCCGVVRPGSPHSQRGMSNWGAGT